MSKPLQNFQRLEEQWGFVVLVKFNVKAAVHIVFAFFSKFRNSETQISKQILQEKFIEQCLKIYIQLNGQIIFAVK